TACRGARRGAQQQQGPGRRTQRLPAARARRGPARGAGDRRSTGPVGRCPHLRVVLVIDEAQDLSVDALEQVRLLTNLETDTRKLLQVVLLGQPELRDLLARPDLRQLAQRITARFHLTPLDPGETAEYLRHRFRIAGGTRFPFDRRATRRIHAKAGGVPRLVNVVAERALLAGAAPARPGIEARPADRAAREVRQAPPRRPLGRALATSAVLVAAAVAVYAWPRIPPAPAVP